MEPEVVRTPQKAEGANPKPKKSVTLPVGTAPQTRRPRAASDIRHKTSKTSDRGKRSPSSVLSVESHTELILCKILSQTLLFLACGFR